MIVKVLKTTDGKYRGKSFDVPSLTQDSAKSALGRSFDFKNTVILPGGKVQLQSEHYTVLLQIMEQ